jgi:predicted ATPase/DNA-binding CsgD family transcriptional regulator
VPQDLGQLAPPLLGRTAPGTTFLADGDAVVAFPSAVDALAAARERPGARLALHAGAAHQDGDALAGPGVSRARRLLELAHPGQVLISGAVADLLPDDAPLEDLGLHRLRDLSPPLRVFALRGGTPSPPLRSLDATPNNLPSWPTTFVGRDAELADLQGRLAGTRLLTIAGPGGSGKTRLAAQLLAEQSGRFPDGAWWIELGPLVDAADVATAVANALGVLVDAGSGTADALRAQLRDRRLLLCLDNCEHVLDAAAQVADALRDCPEVAVIATSREPLALAGETVWRLDPLAPPEARALFLERAAPLRPDLALDAETDAAIPSMCRRLDGSPLALELAAAWTGTLTPRQIEAGLDDRFALLVRSPRDAVPRHASLLASMAWSHDLLDDVDRVVFRRLAAFTGSFDLAAAQAVCAGGEVDPGAVLGALGRLVDKSLVVAHDGRYRLAETIRQYAADRLRAAGERTATADRHLDHFLGRVQAAAPAREDDKDAWRAALAPEHDNLRAATDHGLEAVDPARGRELAAELPWLWHLHRQGREGVEVLHRAIARAPDDRSPLQARLLAGVALVADTAGPLDVEVDAAQRAQTLAEEHGDERLLALCLALAAVGRLYTDLDGARETSLEAERLAARSGERFVTDAGAALRGIVLHLRDRHDEASALLLQAADALAAHGDRGVASTALAFAAESARLTGDLDAALTLAERSIATAAPLHDHLRIGMGRSALALAHGAAGDVGAGLAALDPLLPLVDDAAVFLPDVARALGTLHLWAGDAERAVRRLAAEAASSDGGQPTFLAVRALPALAAAQRATGDTGAAAKTAAEAVVLARARGMPAVLADALAEQAALAPDAEAFELHHEALALRAEHGLAGGMRASLAALAALGTNSEEQDARLRAALADARAAPDDRSALAEAVALARRGRGSRRRPDRGWESLTPAELEVVRLVAEGLSNPEIGARLFMSRSTVKTHLSHVYAKLDVANRTELAARYPDAA